MQEVISPEEGITEVMLDLQSNIPLNDLGMPSYIYRPDLLPTSLKELPDDRRQAYIRNAQIALFYSDGFPTTREGTLFWDRLDFEGESEFLLFRKYLEMSQQHGYRSIQILARAMINERVATHNQRSHQLKAQEENNIFLDVEKPVSLPSLMQEDTKADIIASTVQHLRQLFVMFFWRQRAEAFDLVGHAAVRKIRESRAILLEDHHFIKLSSMVNKVMGRFDNFSADELAEGLNPVDTVKVLKELIQLQRVATGLPAAAPADAHLPGQQGANASTSVEEHLRNMHNAKGAQQSTANRHSVLDDEDTAELAQELVIRMMRNKQAQAQAKG